MCDLGVFEEDAKTHTAHSNKAIRPLCPICEKTKDKKMMINTIYRNKSIGCSCSDKLPYGEKFMFSILEQLGVKFQTQLTKTTFDWCGKYRYDFYFRLNVESILIETHGKQHYKDCSWIESKITQENDMVKKELALNNGIKEENYIVIDCRKSELNWIKNSILEDKRLNRLFDLSKIDWIKVEEFALSNRVKEACELKKLNPPQELKDDYKRLIDLYDKDSIRKENINRDFKNNNGKNINEDYLVDNQDLTQLRNDFQSKITISLRQKGININEN